ncbi:MAG: hypothetical protein ACRC28_02910 [Clostridium sp.]|uniref:hypothetical protein n=1 Tax=Clostridium sp. TaxID=1506 RepID=UPI003F2A362C
MDKEKEELDLKKNSGDGARVPVDLEKNMKALEKYLGIDTESSRRPAYFTFGGLFIILFGCLLNIVSSVGNAFLIIGILLEVIGLILIMKKSYWIAYKWNRSIVMYLKDDNKESLEYLEKLPKEEKETEAYKKMKKLLEN